MPDISSQRPLKIYLVCYGAENESWICNAVDRAHAVEQFEDAGRILGTRAMPLSGLMRWL